MHALVYHGPGKRDWEQAADPGIQHPEDVIVRMDTVTICGTDLHILHGDVPDTQPGTILGHEGIGTIEEVGPNVTLLKKGDRVLVPAITADGICQYCRKGMYSHCVRGGWILGHNINGLQAEYARVPYGDTSLYKVPEGLSDEQVIFLADILPTAYECGVLNGRVAPGDTVAIVGAGPIGLSAAMLSSLLSPQRIISIDLADSRLELAKQFGADVTINNGREDPVQRIMDLTDGEGVDVAMEAVGVPATFELCTQLIRPGGRVANIGVHGVPVTLHLEKLWDRNIAITTRLVDGVTIPVLLDLIRAGRIDATRFATHTFNLNEAERAYETFSHPEESRAIKVLLKAA